MVLQFCRRAGEMNVFMHQPILKPACPTTEEAQFGIGIEAAMANPAAEEEILARNPEAGSRRIRGECGADLVAECGLNFLVGIEREHPVGASFPQREVLLRS